MLGDGGYDLRLLLAPDPSREGKRFGMHVLEARRLQPCFSPCDSPPMGSGSGQALPDFGSQGSYEIKSSGIAERPLPEARCGRKPELGRFFVSPACTSSGTRHEGEHNDQNA